MTPMQNYVLAMTWPMQASIAFWTTFARSWPQAMGPMMMPVGLTEASEAAAAGAAAVAKGTPTKPRSTGTRNGS